MDRGHLRRSSSRQWGAFFLVSVLAFLHHISIIETTVGVHVVNTPSS
jgi:hypothetical protein